MDGTASSAPSSAPLLLWGQCFALAATQHGHQERKGRWVRLCSSISCLVGSRGALLIAGLLASSPSASGTGGTSSCPSPPFSSPFPSSSITSALFTSMFFISWSSIGFPSALTLPSASPVLGLIGFRQTSTSSFSFPASEKASPSSPGNRCYSPSGSASSSPSPSSQSCHHASRIPHDSHNQDVRHRISR